MGRAPRLFLALFLLGVAADTVGCGDDEGCNLASCDSFIADLTGGPEDWTDATVEVEVRRGDSFVQSWTLVCGLTDDEACTDMMSSSAVALPTAEFPTPHLNLVVGAVQDWEGVAPRVIVTVQTPELGTWTADATLELETEQRSGFCEDCDTVRGALKLSVIDDN